MTSPSGRRQFSLLKAKSVSHSTPWSMAASTQRRTAFAPLR
jgi:hypothetical protein